MKCFENPEIQVEKLEVMDMITTSNDCDVDTPDCDNDLGL